ncbi:hypothetical protein F5B21DRAFT_119409, partial [Xylaria acuta]
TQRQARPPASGSGPRHLPAEGRCDGLARRGRTAPPSHLVDSSKPGLNQSVFQQPSISSVQHRFASFAILPLSPSRQCCPQRRTTAWLAVLLLHFHIDARNSGDIHASRYSTAIVAASLGSIALCVGLVLAPVEVEVVPVPVPVPLPVIVDAVPVWSGQHSQSPPIDHAGPPNPILRTHRQPALYPFPSPTCRHRPKPPLRLWLRLWL